MSPRNAAEVGQRRAYTFRGESFPSVTTLLKAWPQEWAIPYGAKHVAERALSSDGLDRIDRYINQPEYADGDYDDLLRWLKAAPYERRDAAAETGTARHGYLEDRLRGHGVPDDLSPAEVAIEQFLAVYRPDPVFIEAQVVNVGDRYAGSLDLIADVYGRRLLIDLKSSNAYDPLAARPSKAGGDHKDRLQLAAYRYADIVFEDDVELGPVPQVDGCAILAIPRDHPEAGRLIEVKAGPAEFRAFLRFADAWRWYDANRDEAIGQQILPQVEEGAA